MRKILSVVAMLVVLAVLVVAGIYAWSADVTTTMSFDAQTGGIAVASLDELDTRLQSTQRLVVDGEVVGEIFHPDAGVSHLEETPDGTVYVTWDSEITYSDSGCVDLYQKDDWIIESTDGLTFTAFVVITTSTGVDRQTYLDVYSVTIPADYGFEIDGDGFYYVDEVCPLPTDVLVFDFRVDSCTTDHAIIRWKTANESTILGFKLYKDGIEYGSFIEAKSPGWAMGNSYEFIDNEMPGEFYSLAVILSNGRVAGVVSDHTRCRIMLPYVCNHR